MASERITWTNSLSEEDLQFLKRFLLASGSLKALAKEYGISYPTVRARLDRLIGKVQTSDETVGLDAFQRELRILVADGALAPAHARKLLAAHQQSFASTEGDSDGTSE